jgi:chromosome segregation ATPase
MRQLIFRMLGVLEVAVALTLLFLAQSLPTAPDVQGGFDQARKIADSSASQANKLSQQLRELRRPELHELARKLQTQLPQITHRLREQKLDSERVHLVSKALADIAQGLDGLVETLDPAGVARVGEGLKATADFFENKVVPAAGRAATRLEKSTGALRDDAKRLTQLLTDSPPDLQFARDIHAGLVRFTEGLERMDRFVKGERLEVMKEGFKGLENSLSTAASQVEKLGGYTYPAARFEGLKLVVEEKKFWPEGEEIADGMRKGAKGIAAAAKEVETLAGDLPQIRAALDESRKAALKTREVLGKALEEHKKLEPILKNIPAATAHLAEELPALGTDLAKVLRDTEQLKEVATALRDAQKGVDTAVARWPDLRKTLGQSAKVIRSTQEQLDQAVGNEAEFDMALKQTLNVADAFALLLPTMTSSLESQLGQQEQSLSDLGQSLEEVGTALPGLGESATRLLALVRWLLMLVAVLVAGHGLVLCLSRPTPATA